jgi:HK97 family phage portal protein
MGSLLGMLAKPRNQGPPVPMSPGSYLGGTGAMPLGGGGYLAYMSAFASNGTVWQIAHLLAQSVAKPEWRLYQKTQRDGRVRYTTSDQGSDQRREVVVHPALTVLGCPAPVKAGALTLPAWTRFSLFEYSQLHLELCGEAYWVIGRDPRVNWPMSLWPVRPDRMEPVPDAENFLKGWVYRSPDGRELVPLDVEDVIQVKYPNPLDPHRGLGPAQAVLADIEAARYGAEWNRNFFLNSAVPGGVIQVDHAMGDDEWNDLTRRWREAHRGVARAHRVAVLEAGQTWVPNAHSMRDMDFGHLRDLQRDLIREAWGIHKIMLGNSDDVNRANAQTGEEVFANWSVAPRLDRWQDALNYQLLPLFGAAGDGVEFGYIFPTPKNREQDQAELIAKTAAAETLIAAGFDAAAVLEVVGLPDMPWKAPAVPAKPAVAETANEGKLAARLQRVLSAQDGTDGDCAGGGESVAASIRRSAVWNSLTGAR